MKISELSDQDNDEHRCPKCGYVMCQQFDYKPINPMAGSGDSER